MNLFGRNYCFQSYVYSHLLNPTWLNILNHKYRLISHSEKACTKQVMDQDLESHKIQSHPLNSLSRGYDKPFLFELTCAETLNFQFYCVFYCHSTYHSFFVIHKYHIIICPF